MCDNPECDSDPCIYDDDVQEGMIMEMVSQQVEEGYFDG